MTSNRPSLNPFAYGDPDAIAKIAISLLPTAPAMSPEEQAKFDRERAADQARYQEARFGALPPNCWRILSQGSIVGWTYDLEIDGLELTLKPANGLVYDLPREEVIELARCEIAKRRGQEASQAASFRFVWGGSL